jgi:hypothetical protein
MATSSLFWAFDRPRGMTAPFEFWSGTAKRRLRGLSHRVLSVGFSPLAQRELSKSLKQLVQLVVVDACSLVRRQSRIGAGDQRSVTRMVVERY